METEDQQTPGRQQSPTSAISNAAVQILRRYSGRGPVKARTHINGDLVTVVLGDTLTTAERTLVDAGQWEHVEAARLKMQQVMKGDLVAVVEAETQRKVTAFISANHCDPDLAIESFVLAPQ